MTRRHWTTPLIVIFSVGVVLYLFGRFAEVGEDAAEPLKDFGIALCTAVIVGVLVDRLLHESLVTGVDKGIHRLEEGSDVLRGATRSKMVDVFARRGSEDDRDQWKERIRYVIGKQLDRRRGEIRVACVAAPQIFRRDADVGALLWDTLAAKDPGVELKVVLLCPESEAARVRAEIEAPHPTITDIRAAESFLSGLRKASGGRAEVRCSEQQPTAFVVLTDDYLMLEPYPLGLAEGGDPLGGKSPVTVFRRASDAYESWSRHFAYLWGSARPAGATDAEAAQQTQQVGSLTLAGPVRDETQA